MKKANREMLTETWLQIQDVARMLTKMGYGKVRFVPIQDEEPMSMEEYLLSCETYDDNEIVL